MNHSINYFKEKIDLVDKFLTTLILLIPISLAISIFAADLFASISGVLLLFIIFKKENFKLFKTIKKEIIYFLLLYLIIILSLITSEFREQSFLASFFYFRYFFLTLSIFYLLKKYNFLIKIFSYFFLLSIFIVIFDASFQYIFGYNLFGYEFVSRVCCELHHLTGFFNKEKKLGSYLVRFFPVVLCLIYLIKPNISFKIEIFFLISIGILIFFSTERVALFLLLIIYFFYFLISDKKMIISTLIISVFAFLFLFDSDIAKKTIYSTIKQTGLNFLYNESPRPINKDLTRYYSYEHENLTYTGYMNFLKNPFLGSGVKTFFHQCNKNKPRYQFKINSRNNKLVCSTHPHNTYIQILSEIGIFGFLLITYFFLKVLISNFKILIFNNKSYIVKAYFFINLSIIVNLMPFIPSGSFFNNWMSLMMFFPIGIWLYIKEKK